MPRPMTHRIQSSNVTGLLVAVAAATLASIRPVRQLICNAAARHTTTNTAVDHCSAPAATPCGTLHLSVHGADVVRSCRQECQWLCCAMLTIHAAAAARWMHNGNKHVASTFVQPVPMGSFQSHAHLVFLVEGSNVVLEGVCHPSVADPYV